MADERITVKTTCPRDCYDACGIAVVRRGDKVKVLGDPDHRVSRGALCGKCAIAYNGIYLDPNQRLLRPLKRVGTKGEGKFAPISWDEALGLIATKLKAIITDHGPAPILHSHYTGTCSQLAGAYPMRFFNAIGATEVEPDTICNMAGHVALGLTLGSSTDGFDPRTAKDAACLMIWGANPAHSAPHAHKHWINETPAELIVIDPIRHETAAAADLYLQPFPGSDAALAFALLHVIRREGLLDRAFIAAHTLGWEKLEPLLDPCTPAWGEAMTGVPAGDIEHAARLYGRGPSLLWLGQGLQRQPTGGNIFRACSLLPAACGHFGKPGTGFLFLNGGARRGIAGDLVARPDLRREPPRSVSQMDLAGILEDRARARALILWNVNIAASNPEQARLHCALARDDLFTVVIDLFQTDSADFADIVLPAASFLEFDDIVTSYFNLTISAQNAALPPMGEALPNQEIFRRLARAMGLSEPALQEPDRPILDRLAQGTGIAGGFAALQAKGTVDRWPEPAMHMPGGVFPTPSGKFEFASDAARELGAPELPQPWVDRRPAAGHFRLLSPASAWLMNSSYGNDPRVAEKNRSEDVTLHPEDAKALGLEAGATVELANETGRLRATLAVAPILPRGTALASKSRWVKGSAERGNINRLNPGTKTDLGESSAVHGVEVTIRGV